MPAKRTSKRKPPSKSAKLDKPSELLLYDSNGKVRIRLDASSLTHPLIELTAADGGAMVLCADQELLRFEIRRRGGSLSMVITSSPEGLLIASQNAHGFTTARYTVDNRILTPEALGVSDQPVQFVPPRFPSRPKRTSP